MSNFKFCLSLLQGLWSFSCFSFPVLAPLAESSDKMPNDQGKWTATLSLLSHPSHRVFPVHVLLHFWSETNISKCRWASPCGAFSGGRAGSAGWVLGTWRDLCSQMAQGCAGAESFCQNAFGLSDAPANLCQGSRAIIIFIRTETLSALETFSGWLLEAPDSQKPSGFKMLAWKMAALSWAHWIRRWMSQGYFWFLPNTLQGQ